MAGYIASILAIILRALARVAGLALARKRAEETHAALEKQLFRAQKLEALGTLAGGIAPDFNNLLTAILGNVSLAELPMTVGDPGYLKLREASRAGLNLSLGCGAPL